MAVPSDRRYTPTHEWCKPEGDSVVVGITKFAADQLTDITYVELPKVGQQIAAGQPFGEIESVKSAGDLYAPVSGKVIAVNVELAGDPGLINRDPFSKAWMIRVQPSNPAEMDELIDSATYEADLAE